MNQLFTFNSQQFEALRPLPQPPHIRKRIIKTGDGKRTSPRTCPSTSPQNISQDAQRQPQQKKVSFHQIPSPQPTHSTSHTDKHYPSEEIDPLPSKKAEGSSSNYQMVLRKLTSVEVELQKQNNQKIQGSKAITPDQPSQRRQRRVKSVKQSPRVLFPLSDKKLPKAFKMGSCDPSLPQIKIVRKGKNELVDIHDNFSYHRSRTVLERERKVFSLKRDLYFSQERAAFTPRI